MSAVDGAAHYFFPPARAYALNRCLFLLKSDAEFCQRYVGNREAAMDELDLPAEGREALRAFERDRLIALGAHQGTGQTTIALP